MNAVFNLLFLFIFLLLLVFYFFITYPIISWTIVGVVFLISIILLSFEDKIKNRLDAANKKENNIDCKDEKQNNNQSDNNIRQQDVNGAIDDKINTGG